MDKNRLVAMLLVITGILSVLLLLFNNSLAPSMLVVSAFVLGLASSAFIYLFVVQKSRPSPKGKFLLVFFLVTNFILIVLPLIKKFL